MIKKCIKCGQERKHNRNASRASGFSTYCAECDRARERDRALRKALAGKQPDPAASAPRAPDAVVTETRAERETQRIRAEHRGLITEVERLRAELRAVAHMQAGGPSLVPISRSVETKGEAVACMLASDWHVEEPVIASKVHGINEYNLTIAESRMRAFFANGLRLTEITRRDVSIDTIWLGFLGDFITGHIHEELRETNELAPGEAARFVLAGLTSGIEFLLAESDFKLEIDAVPGNHGRMTIKPRIQNATETSLETFMYHSLAHRFANNPRVRIRVADSKMLYRKFFDRFVMRVIHGDDIKFGGGVGGVTIPIRKKLAAWDKAVKADLTVMGHFHQLLNGGDFIVNGSLIGYNEFAQAIGASPEEARQAFFLIHNRNGGELSLNAPIWLDRERHR